MKTDGEKQRYRKGSDEKGLSDFRAG